MPVYQTAETETVFSGELKWHTTNEGQHAVLRFSERPDEMSIDLFLVPSAAPESGESWRPDHALSVIRRIVEEERSGRCLGPGGAVTKRLDGLIRFHERLGVEPVQRGATQMRMIRKYLR